MPASAASNAVPRVRRDVAAAVLGGDEVDRHDREQAEHGGHHDDHDQRKACVVGEPGANACSDEAHSVVLRETLVE